MKDRPREKPLARGQERVERFRQQHWEDKQVKRKEANDDLSVAADQRFAAQEAEEIRTLLRQTPRDCVVIGQKLSAVRSRLKHGEWGAWLRSELCWDDLTAQRFVNVSEQFKNDKWGFLNLAPSALYWLAAPSAPRGYEAEFR